VGQKEHSHAIHQKIAKIKKLKAREVKLVDELEISLALKELWPEVFDAGPCNLRFEGGRMFHRYIVTRGDGVEKTWQLPDVPTILWYKTLMKIHAQANMAGWPSALRKEYMRRREAGKGTGRLRTRLEDR